MCRTLENTPREHPSLEVLMDQFEDLVPTRIFSHQPEEEISEETFLAITRTLDPRFHDAPIESEEYPNQLVWMFEHSISWLRTNHRSDLAARLLNLSHCPAEVMLKWR